MKRQFCKWKDVGAVAPIRTSSRIWSSLKVPISSLTEATAYVARPVLGPRLKLSTELVNAIEGRSIKEILGYPDHLKFHKSMTLFARADPDQPVFEAALQKYFGGNFDQSTLDRLR